LFLDEIGSLGLNAQAKLLRVLETQQYRPVGGTTDKRSDFRVVTATNERLASLANVDRFRWDLLHRLQGMVLVLPALRERVEDIPLLVAHFLANHRAPTGEALTITGDALRILQQHDWPGNVRELRHVLERAALLTDSPLIDAETVLIMISQECRWDHPVEVRTSRRQHLIALLQEHGWDTRRVAMHLEVHRATVYRRMKQLGIATPERFSQRPVSSEREDRIAGIG
jgi:transcriptional regulator with PAS, ATPase and Fis domain